MAAAALLLSTRCGSAKPSPGGPAGPTTSNPPQLSCPADLTVGGVPSPSQNVTYDAPATTDGAAPVNVVCSPASGASFPLGTTAVSCQATDAMSRQASCSFNVTLKGMSTPAKTYDAVGDSITIGENGIRGVVDLPNAYPTKLQLDLEAVYPGQGITVLNHGDGGKRIDDLINNLVKFVTADRPDVVLFEGGYNDLLGDCGNSSINTNACRNTIRSVVPLGYRDAVRRSKESPRNVKYVFAMTLTPPGPVENGYPFDRRISRDAIEQTNSGIRQYVASEGGVLVDVYPLFAGHESDYVDADGLHLRPAGYQAIADAVFAAIQKTIPQTPLFAFIAPR